MRLGSPPLLEIDVSPASGEDQPRLWAALTEITATQPALSLRSDRDGNTALLGGPTPDLLQAAIAHLALESAVELKVGEARVAWREQLLGEARIDHTHKRQTGGSGEFARVLLAIVPAAFDGSEVFSSRISRGSVPLDFIPAVEAGVMRAALAVERFPVIGFRVELLDGAYHDVDSTAAAFEAAGWEAFRRACANAGTRTVEPVAAVEILISVRQADMLMDTLGRIGGDWTLLEPATAIVAGEVPASCLVGCMAAIDQLGGGAKVAFSHYVSSPAPAPEDGSYNSPKGARRMVVNGGAELDEDWDTVRHRQTLEGLADVAAGNVIDHEVVAAWMDRLTFPPRGRGPLPG